MANDKVISMLALSVDALVCGYDAHWLIPPALGAIHLNQILILTRMQLRTTECTQVNLLQMSVSIACMLYIWLYALYLNKGGGPPFFSQYNRNSGLLF